VALVWVLLGILVLGGVAVVAAGRGQGLTAAVPDRPDLSLPADRPLDRSDVDRVRFSVGLRGYRMDEVDDVLDRLAMDLEARDARIAVLEQQATGAAPADAAAGTATAQAPVEPAAVQEATGEERSGEEQPGEQAAEDVPAEDAAVEDVPGEDVPGEDAPGEEASSDEDLQVERTMIVPFQPSDGSPGPAPPAEEREPGPPAGPFNWPPGAAGA
jgi:DivIVA domain-containing protein